MSTPAEAGADVTELRTLVIRAQSGDLETFGRIVRRFQDMACGYAYAILGDFHLAEDAAQEAFIQAYRDLPKLDEPAAFPGWFRRIVFKHCDRLVRRKRVTAVPLESAAAVASGAPAPAERAKERELADKVLAAVRALPDDQRTVTTLFYINGYTQRDIAEFLEVPVTTVNNRLHASRERLRERMAAMVDETLKSNAPDERFSQAVIDGLLGRPHPLEMEGHPVRQVWDAIRAALPGYELVGGPEVVDVAQTPEFCNRWRRVYMPRPGVALRPEMTQVTFEGMRGRTPPVRLLAAGRVFRPDSGEDRPLKVFHQADVLCVEKGTNLDALKATLRHVLTAVLGSGHLHWLPHEYEFVREGMDVEVERDGKRAEIAGCGLLNAESMREAGFDPEAVGGFSFGIGLERLAALKYGIDDVRKLWQPPYVPD
jgi:RNA polymerase sigma factor (sigma-70 family)